ncbi:MAG: TonB-dependent receptor [Emcibacter sp.]|nr:TonB-dependent receptor [Emcibacter sp.]
MKYQVSVLALIPFALPTVSLAENMDEMVVTASRYEQPLSNIGSSISVITADDLQQSQNVFIQDMLQNIPGVSLNQTGSFGGVSSVRIRGADTSQTVVLIDGVQVNDVSGTGGGFNFANLDPNGIERIEILRGPQSILYGSDAIGGVINIITKSGGKGLGGSAFVEGGSFETFRGGVNLHGGTDKLKFNFSMSGITTDGISKADENDGNTEEDGYNNITVQGKVTARVSEIITTEVIARYSDSENEFDDFGADGDRVGTTEEFMIAGRVHAILLDGRFKNSFSLEYSSTDRRNETNGVESYLAEGTRLNLDYFGRYTVSDDIGISFGAQHEETKVSTLSDQKFDIDSLFSEVSFQGISDLTLTAGLRYDNHNKYGDTVTPRLTASYQIPDSGTRVFATWGEGFKAPSVFQLSASYGNINLKPEETTGWDVGIEQTLFDGGVILTTTYFKQNIKNNIDYVCVWPANTNCYKNINAVRSKGVEVSIAAQVHEQVNISANYTYTDSIDRDTGEKLERIPAHAAYGQIAWQAMEGLNLTASLTYNGKELPRNFSAGVDGWVRADLRASYDITEQVSVYGRIDNLFDKEYQQVSGYGTPDRSAFVGIRGKF